jgi:hypothetical protein
VLGRDISYFVKHFDKKKSHSDSTKKFSESDTINIFEFLIDNIFVIFGGRVVQTVLLFSSTCSFIRMRQFVLKKIKRKLARSFNLTFRYIDDVLSLNNYRFGDVVDRIYPIELEIKDTTYTDISASYLELHLKIDSEGWLRTKL